MREICHFCLHPIRSLDDYLILDHPNSGLPRAYFTHISCGSEDEGAGLLGYGVELKRIVKPNRTQTLPGYNDDSLEDWLNHLRWKNWFNTGLVLWIERAHQVAKAIHESASVSKTLRSAVPRSNVPPAVLPAVPQGTRIRDARQRINPKVRLFIFARDNHQCVECGNGPPLVVDHVMPVSHGGSGEPDNLQSLCAPCNQRKGATVP